MNSRGDIAAVSGAVRGAFCLCSTRLPMLLLPAEGNAVMCLWSELCEM